MIIDFHTHIFPDNVCARIVEGMSIDGGIVHYTNASAAELSASMKAAGIDYSVDLPVATRVDQVEKVNSRMIRQRDELLAMGIIAFGCMHPDYPDYKKEILRLKDAGIVGIKLHPAYQGYDLNDLRYKRIIEAISDAGMITISHCGWDIGYVQHNFASVDMILEIIKDVAPERFVAAHMGGWSSWPEITNRLLGAPIWIDCACSLGENIPRADIDNDRPLMYPHNLLPNQFAHMARKQGTDRVLFASDSPWQDQSQYLQIVKNCGLTADEQAQILGDNAARLLESVDIDGAVQALSADSNDFGPDNLSN